MNENKRTPSGGEVAESLNQQHQQELYWMIHDYFQRLAPDGSLPVDADGNPAFEPMNTYPRIDPEDYDRNDQPDDAMHNYRTFHEFGNFSHPARVLERWREFRRGDSEIFAHLEKPIVEQLEQHFAAEIDGLSKADLIEIAVFFHDIAKHISPLYPDDPRWPPSLRNHERHEKIGADFLRTYKPVRQLLTEKYGLTQAQIEYVTSCVEHHFELGETRRHRVEQNLPYDYQYTQSEECQQICDQLIAAYPDMAVEIGALFLIDSAGKTTEGHIADSESDYSEYLAKLHQRVLDGEVEARLERALTQLTLNFQVAKVYLNRPGLKY